MKENINIKKLPELLDMKTNFPTNDKLQVGNSHSADGAYGH